MHLLSQWAAFIDMCQTRPSPVRLHSDPLHATPDAKRASARDVPGVRQATARGASGLKFAVVCDAAGV